MLDGMPPVEHASFLGHWLYLLVQVHDAYLVSHYTRHAVWFASSAQGCPPRLWQGVYPEARVGKLTGMLLEQDVDQIVPLLFLPEMVRSTSPSIVAHSSRLHTRPPARSYWIKSRRRNGCLTLHTPPPTTTDPNPIPAPSQLTVSRHAPTRVRVLNVRSSLLFHEASPQTALSICTLSARRRHRRRWNLRWARLWRATPRCTLPPPCPLISQGRTLHSHNAQCQTPLYLHHPSVLSTCSSTPSPSSPCLPLRPLALACTRSALSPPCVPRALLRP